MRIADYPFIAWDPTATVPSSMVTVKGPGARPYLWVRISNTKKQKAIIVPAIVDTGADECALPARDAKSLGHDLFKGIPKNVDTAGGPTRAFTHTKLTIEILGIRKNGHADITMVHHAIQNVAVDFTKGLSVYTS